MVGVRGWYIKRTCCVIIALSTAAISPDMVIGFVIPRIAHWSLHVGLSDTFHNYYCKLIIGAHKVPVTVRAGRSRCSKPASSISFVTLLCQ